MYTLGKCRLHCISASFLPLQKRPELEARAADLERQSAAIVVPRQSSAETYEKLRIDIAALEKLIMAEVLRPERCLHFMRPGRLVQVKKWQSPRRIIHS
jgi:hypothetical protein